MPGQRIWAGPRGLQHRLARTSIYIMLLYLSLVYTLSQSVQPNHESLSVPDRPKKLESNSTSLKGSHYVTNTYLRSDLRENQAGMLLFLQITVLDSRSCAPIENALVEIWGANKDGKYSAEHDEIDAAKYHCSSWLRGGSATDSEGIVKFKTIYPGSEPKRAPHINAIIRSDWYEYANNQTIASDSTESVAALGQIFFPDDVNGHVYKNSTHTDALTKSDHEVDPFFKAHNSSWRAEAKLFMDGKDGIIRAQLTISIDLTAPQKVSARSLYQQCSGKSDDLTIGNGASPKPISLEQNSTAAIFQPHMVVILMITMMIIYNMQGHRGGSDRENINSNERKVVGQTVI